VEGVWGNREVPQTATARQCILRAVNPEAWPTPSEGASREPLPRVEDLPVADHGYDQASVKVAFDSFYRHAAQLDAALRTLEAVDSFHRQAAALRADLRTLRTSGWTQQPYPGPTTGYGRDVRGQREGVSPAVWRLLGEIVFLIAVSVFLGVAKLPWWVIVSVMGGAFLIVAIIEWAASRDRWSTAAPARVPAHPVVEAQPATVQADEGESIGWAAFEQAQEPSDAMTMIGVPQEASAENRAPDEEPVAEPEPVAEAAVERDDESDGEAREAESAPVLEPAGEGEPSPRRRWWRRGAPPGGEAAPGTPTASQEAPRHVRVLAADEDGAGAAVDPWEQGFDPGPAADDRPPAVSEEETGEHEAPLAAETESPSRRRFRRR
jgi:hypothetical protein